MRFLKMTKSASAQHSNSYKHFKIYIASKVENSPLAWNAFLQRYIFSGCIIILGRMAEGKFRTPI